MISENVESDPDISVDSGKLRPSNSVSDRATVDIPPTARDKAEDSKDKRKDSTTPRTPRDKDKDKISTPRSDKKDKEKNKEGKEEGGQAKTPRKKPLKDPIVGSEGKVDSEESDLKNEETDGKDNDEAEKSDELEADLERAIAKAKEAQKERESVLGGLNKDEDKEKKPETEKENEKQKDIGEGEEVGALSDEALEEFLSSMTKEFTKTPRSSKVVTPAKKLPEKESVKDQSSEADRDDAKEVSAPTPAVAPHPNPVDASPRVSESSHSPESSGDRARNSRASDGYTPRASMRRSNSLRVLPRVVSANIAHDGPESPTRSEVPFPLPTPLPCLSMSLSSPTLSLF